MESGAFPPVPPTDLLQGMSRAFENGDVEGACAVGLERVRARARVILDNDTVVTQRTNRTDMTIAVKDNPSHRRKWA